jgi:hypothetical protein
MWVAQWVELGGVVPEERVAELCDGDLRLIDKGLQGLAVDNVELVWWPEQ